MTRHSEVNFYYCPIKQEIWSERVNVCNVIGLTLSDIYNDINTYNKNNDIWYEMHQ